MSFDQRQDVIFFVFDYKFYKKIRISQELFLDVIYLKNVVAMLYVVYVYFLRHNILIFVCIR